MNLHSEIMNIECGQTNGRRAVQTQNGQAYKLGHRDARHAAAELSLKADAHIAFKTGEVCSYQLGWDYNHDGDSYYNSIDSVDEAGSIFFDAQKLFEQAESWNEESK